MPTLASPRSSEPHAGGRARRASARASWPLERILFLLAGTVTGLSAVLAATLSLWFLLLTGFVALNQLAYVAFGDCPTSLLLRRLGATAGCER